MSMEFKKDETVKYRNIFLMLPSFFNVLYKGDRSLFKNSLLLYIIIKSMFDGSVFLNNNSYTFHLHLLYVRRMLDLVVINGRELYF